MLGKGFTTDQARSQLITTHIHSNLGIFHTLLSITLGSGPGKIWHRIQRSLAPAGNPGPGHSNLGFWVCLKIGYLPRLSHVYGENDVPNQQNVGDVPEKKSGIPGIPGDIKGLFAVSSHTSQARAALTVADPVKLRNFAAAERLHGHGCPVVSSRLHGSKLNNCPKLQMTSLSMAPKKTN